MSKVDVLLGLQWGDEGKGKIVDVLAPKYDVVKRYSPLQQPSRHCLRRSGRRKVAE